MTLRIKIYGELELRDTYKHYGEHWLLSMELPWKKKTSVKSYILILPDARFRLVSRDHKQIPDRVVRFPGILFFWSMLQSVLYASEIIRLGLSGGGGGGGEKRPQTFLRDKPPPPPPFTHPPDRNLLGSSARFGLMITTCCSLRGGGEGGEDNPSKGPVSSASTEL